MGLQHAPKGSLKTGVICVEVQPKAMVKDAHMKSCISRGRSGSRGRAKLDPGCILIPDDEIDAEAVSRRKALSEQALAEEKQRLSDLEDAQKLYDEHQKLETAKAFKALEEQQQIEEA